MAHGLQLAEAEPSTQVQPAAYINSQTGNSADLDVASIIAYNTEPL
jgi:hypothetical protein